MGGVSFVLDIKEVNYSLKSITSEAKGRSELGPHQYFSNICTQTTVITQITHGIEGHYSRVPMPSLWVFLSQPHDLYYPHCLPW
jgi:hypothetical protein